jgi:hypothetical protein
MKLFLNTSKFINCRKRIKEFLFEGFGKTVKSTGKLSNEHYMYVFWDKNINSKSNLQGGSFGYKGDKQHDWEEYLQTWKERHPDEV